MNFEQARTQPRTLVDFKPLKAAQWKRLDEQDDGLVMRGGDGARLLPAGPGALARRATPMGKLRVSGASIEGGGSGGAEAPGPDIDRCTMTSDGLSSFLPLRSAAMHRVYRRVRQYRSPAPMGSKGRQSGAAVRVCSVAQPLHSRLRRGLRP